jgi:hypothetical protein
MASRQDAFSPQTQHARDWLVRLVRVGFRDPVYAEPSSLVQKLAPLSYAHFVLVRWAENMFLSVLMRYDSVFSECVNAHAVA